VFGIDIELHLFFILFILAFLLISLEVALLLMVIFFFVTLHELSHCLVAIKNGIRVKRIILLPIGGMSMIESADIKPMTEIKMSLAGPLLNITIVYICLAIAYIFSIPLGTWLNMFFSPSDVLALSIPELLFFYTFYANLILGLFNLLLPAFPLDGGRIFRAVLALKLDYVQASRIAKNVSLVIAALMFLVSFVYGQLWVMIISFFIAFGAVAEYNAMVLHLSLSRIQTKSAVTKDYIIVGEKESIKQVAEKMLARRKMDALIKTKKGLYIVNLADISKLPKKEWKKKAVSIAKKAVKASASTNLEAIAKGMELKDLTTVPIFDGKKLIGVIERFDVEKLVKIRESLETSS